MFSKPQSALRIFPLLAMLLALALAAPAEEAGAITIVRIEPQVGSAVANTVVEIRGTGFPERPQVFFDDTEAEVLLADIQGELNRLLVSAPPSRDGRVDVRVVDPDAPNRFGTSEAIDGDGYEFVGEAVVVPIIAGRVTIKSSGKALIGAHITTMPGGRAGIADLQGAYSVVLPSAGTYTVRAYASGFRSASHVVTVNHGDTVRTLNLDLERFAPSPADSDGDGLSDEAEATRYNTDPFNADTDSDGLSDGNEIKAGLDPLNFFDGDIFRRADTDFSGVVDARDLQFVINACVKGDSSPNADINADGTVSAADIQLAINVIVGTLFIQ
ncbi:MAG: carboxypeptidase regulatory-like domain-containing protein [FCB group bacterium]|jgi:hypothetical protein|nr:carboxypeptidase regulatory-like domain-containing protein [FCB group bacterium]